VASAVPLWSCGKVPVRPRYLVLGTWYLGCGVWYLLTDAWHVVRGTWYAVRGTCYLVPGPWHVVPGIRGPVTACGKVAESTTWASLRAGTCAKALREPEAGARVKASYLWEEIRGSENVPPLVPVFPLELSRVQGGRSYGGFGLQGAAGPQPSPT